MPPARRILTLVAAVALAAVLWWTQSDADLPGGGTSQGDSSSQSNSASDQSNSASDVGVDPDSGLPWIAEDQLPAEAHDTLALIDGGGPYPYDEDDSVFGNREGLLPDREHGYYREYTVDTPGLDHRGAKRIVTGAQAEYYWTQDHYASFARIQRDES